MSIDCKPFDDVTRALTGLGEYTTLIAERGEVLVVSVIATRPEAACPRCGEFSVAVKSAIVREVRDVSHAGTPVVLTVTKRAFKCLAAHCETKTFTQHTDEIPARSRFTQRCREHAGRPGRTGRQHQ